MKIRITNSQPWSDMAIRIVEIMKKRTCHHMCWTIFDIPPSQLLRQPGYEQTIAKCVTWPRIEVRENPIDSWI